ncbi:hypothetical protein H4R35_002069 [Dimargaris xerosporica]|nr:hypothetical protein H4R35_002069 [Dimargaris xerosporica]
MAPLPDAYNLDSLIADLDSSDIDDNVVSKRAETFFTHIYQYNFSPAEIEKLHEVLEWCSDDSLARLWDSVIEPYQNRFTNPTATFQPPAANAQNYPLAFMVYVGQDETVQLIVQSLYMRFFVGDADDLEKHIWSHLLGDLMFTAVLQGSLELVLYLWQLKVAMLQTLEEQDFDTLMYLAARCGHTNIVLALLATVQTESNMTTEYLPSFIDDIIVHAQSQPGLPWTPLPTMSMEQVHPNFAKVDFTAGPNWPFYGTFY